MVIARALVCIGSPAVPSLIEALKDGNVPRETARALGEIGDQRAITPLKARLGFLGIFGGEEDRCVRAKIKAAIKMLEGNQLPAPTTHQVVERYSPPPRSPGPAYSSGVRGTVLTLFRIKLSIDRQTSANDSGAV